jgi:lysozyme
VVPGSLLARCELWLADYREEPQLPIAWSGKGWKLWQYVADETSQNFAYGSEPRHVEGVGHCDRNMFNGDAAELNRFWKNGGRS